jgi:hypothetical protein
MDKNFLGLGITFNAIDNGLGKTVQGLTKDLNNTGKALEDTEKKTHSPKNKGRGFLAGLTDGFKTLTLAKIANDIDSVKDTLTGRQSGLNQTALDLDTLHAKMGQALDPKTASDFTSKISQMIPAFGLTGHQADTIAMAFTQAGASVADMQKTLPMVGTLVGKFGMDAGKVAGMFTQMLGTLHLSAGAAGDLTKSFFKLQKEYNLTDLMSSLPDIIDNVYKNSIRFGKINSKQSAASVIDIGRMAAGFQKVGFSQQQALHMATGWNDKMADIKESILDINAGLEPSSDILVSMQEALGAGGMDVQKIMKMITDGGGDMKAPFDEIKKELAGLDDQQKANAMQRLKRVFGPELAASLGPLADGMNAVDAAAKKQDKGLGSASSEFDKMTEALNGTLSVQQNMTNAAKEYNDIVVTMANKSKYLDVLHQQREAYEGLTKAVGDTNSMLGAMQKLAQGLDKFGAAFLFGGVTKLTPILDIFSGLLTPILSLLGLVQILKGPLVWLGETLFTSGTAAGMLGEAFAFLTGPIGWAIAAFGLLYAFCTPFQKAVDSIAHALNDSFGPALSAIWALVKGLFTNFDETIANLGPSLLNIGDLFVKGWEKFTNMMGDLFDKALNYIGDHWEGWVDGAIDLIMNIPGALDKMFKFLAQKTIDGIKWMLTNWKSMAVGIVLLFAQLPISIPLLIYKAFDAITGGRLSKRVGEGIDKLMDMFLAKFGTSVLELQNKWDGFVDYFKNIGKSIAGIWTSVTDAFSSSSFGQIFNSGASALANGMKSLFSGIFDNLPDFVLAFLKGQGPIGLLMQGGKSLVSAVSGFFSGGPASTPSPAQQMAGTIPGASGALQPSAGTISTASSAQPTMSQPLAPSMSPVSGSDLKPTVIPTMKNSDNQALVQVMADMKDTLAGLLSQLLNKPVNVVLQGDARKLMGVVSSQSNNAAGSLGLNQALAR